MNILKKNYLSKKWLVGPGPRAKTAFFKRLFDLSSNQNQKTIKKSLHVYDKRDYKPVLIWIRLEWFIFIVKKTILHF